MFKKYVAFECHANFEINWESFAHRDQQNDMLGCVVRLNNYLPLNNGGDKSHASIHGTVPM